MGLISLAWLTGDDAGSVKLAKKHAKCYPDDQKILIKQDGCQNVGMKVILEFQT